MKRYNEGELCGKKIRALLQGVRRIQIERKFFRQRPCGTHLHEVRRTACHTSVGGNDPHQAVEPSMAVICAAAVLLKGLQNDSRPEVASTAKELYADRFPYAARNARKKQLHILRMEFSVCSEVIDEYGDVCCEDIQFTLD